MRRSFAAAALLGVAACGSKTDPGSGTQTLTALVEVLGTAERTTVEVDLSAGDNPIGAANVRLEDVDRGNAATAEPVTPGSFRASFTGYARTIRIDLDTPDGDRLEAQLEGPAPHAITRPPDGAIVRRGDFETLRVEWTADGDAESAEVQAGDAAPVRLEGDPGEAEIPLGPLLDGPQTLTVRRATSVELAGGLPGSRMRSRFESAVDFTLQP